jgi:hypothetical protein
MMLGPTRDPDKKPDRGAQYQVALPNTESEEQVTKTELWNNNQATGSICLETS